MYEIHPELKSIQTSNDQIVAIIESINNPMVAAAGKPLEPAKAFIMGVRNASGLFSVYVYLHLLQSKECLIYLHDPAEIPMESYHDIELEALQFVESMGFMVDNLNFRNLPDDQRNELMQRLPLFHEDLVEFARKMKTDGGQDTEDEEVLDLAPLEEGVLDLDDVQEVKATPAIQDALVSEEGLAKIIRMFSSF